MMASMSASDARNEWTRPGLYEVAPGELALRGPQVMVGYWNRPEETAEVLRDGWLMTGDMAVMDEEGR